jgi:hypothetical protein
MLWLWRVLTFLMVRLRSILRVQRIRVASWDGLIKLIVVLVGRLIALRRKVRLGRRLRRHLELEQGSKERMGGCVDARKLRNLKLRLRGLVCFDDVQRWSGGKLGQAAKLRFRGDAC